jgi:hypothetical protein
MARSVGLYVLASLVAIGIAGAVFASIYGAPEDRRAVLVSAGIALVVQALAFVVARSFARAGNGIAGWTLGAVVCLVALVIYGFVSRAVGLPANAAMLSLATFFFLTELIEPPLLNV